MQKEKVKQYGKLENGKIIYLQQPFLMNDQLWFTNNPEIILQAGYKEIIQDDKPINCAYRKYNCKYIEHDTQIIQTWEPSTDNDAEENLAQSYKIATVRNIRKKYSQNDEFKILREYLLNPTDAEIKNAFNNYNSFVEESKRKALESVYEE